MRYSCPNILLICMQKLSSVIDCDTKLPSVSMESQQLGAEEAPRAHSPNVLFYLVLPAICLFVVIFEVDSE